MSNRERLYQHPYLAAQPYPFPAPAVDPTQHSHGSQLFQPQRNSVPASNMHGHNEQMNMQYHPAAEEASRHHGFPGR